MTKNYLLILLLIPLLGFSQEGSFWQQTDESKIKQADLVERTSTPIVYDLFNLDLNSLKQTLADAPDRELNIPSEITVQFPVGKGKMETFEVYNASVLDRDFAANYPEIQSYVAVSREKSGTTIRFSTTIFGFHATVHTIGNTYYIDPMTTDLRTYVMYAKKDLYRYDSLAERATCLVEDDAHNENRFGSDDAFTPENANDGQLRTFRLALACTQNYANYHINAAGQNAATDAVKKATVLAAMNITMTRVNAIFERDMSLTMTLVDNTSIIFLAENDGYSDMPATPTFNPSSTMISQNPGIINANIGLNNYDIGHLFSMNGGGLAQLGGICFNSLKARGVTGSLNPVGDPFDVDFVAHEMGHQFGAPHTFNGTQGSCGLGNRSAATAVEPGSGTTIMAYAGICGSDNVQSNSDDHFHAISIDNMWNRLIQTPICAVNTPNGNTAPTVNAGADYTIPYGTAFTLTGSASDPDGTPLSYCWEQVDVGTNSQVPNTTSTTNPQFRSYSPVATGDRTFPRLQDILAGNLTPSWEVIPNVARTMDFALTVRDNGTPNGGQTNRDDMRVTLANTGPFKVTSQNTNIVYAENATTNVTWDVAGTTANGINTANVNILLSTDGGQTFNTTLASNTPNDGTESVTFPAGVTSGDCRIKVEAVNNIYFAINTAFFAIGNYTIGTTDVCQDYNFNINQVISVSTTNLTGYGLTVNDSYTVSDLNINVNITHPNVGELFFGVRYPNESTEIHQLMWGSCGGSANINLNFDDEGNALNCATTTNNGNVIPQQPLSTADGNNSSGTWIFFITDIANGNSGTLNSVTLNICRQQPVAILGTEEYTLENFSLYPNPNKGEFALSFNSQSGEDIDIVVHDIAGRLVHTKKYNATATFNETISLKNVSTGMYLITVTDQNRTVTKKLIID